MRETLRGYRRGGRPPGVPPVLALAIACSYLVLGLLPLRAPALRALPRAP